MTRQWNTVEKINDRGDSWYLDQYGDTSQKRLVTDALSGYEMTVLFTRAAVRRQTTLELRSSTYMDNRDEHRVFEIEVDAVPDSIVEALEVDA